MRAADVERIATECRQYAMRYHCDFVGALIDWEGDGPTGSWGLGRDEEDAVAARLGLPDNWRDSK